MDHRQIELFLAVAERLNLSQAADAIGISQPGLSKSMGRLQTELGTKLYNRCGRGIELTEAGRALARHGKVLAQQLTEANAELLDLAQGVAGHTRIGAGPSWLSRYLPDSIARIAAANPNLRFTVRTGYPDTLIGQLKQGFLDMVIGAIPENRIDPDLTFTRLTSDKTCAVARTGHELTGRRNLPLSELAERLWVMPFRQELISRRLAATFRQARLPAPIFAVETDSLSFIFATLRRTDLLSFVTAQVLKLEEAVGLSAIDCEALTIRREAGIILRRDIKMSPTVMLLVRDLRKIASGHVTN